MPPDPPLCSAWKRRHRSGDGAEQSYGPGQVQLAEENARLRQLLAEREAELARLAEGFSERKAEQARLANAVAERRAEQARLREAIVTLEARVRSRELEVGASAAVPTAGVLPAVDEATDSRTRRRWPSLTDFLDVLPPVRILYLIAMIAYLLQAGFVISGDLAHWMLLKLAGILMGVIGVSAYAVALRRKRRRA
jgi:hypothetical protein